MYRLNPLETGLDTQRMNPKKIYSWEILIVNGTKTNHNKLIDILSDKKNDFDHYEFHHTSSLKSGLHFIRETNLPIAIIILQISQSDSREARDFIHMVRVSLQKIAIRIIVITDFPEETSNTKKISQYDISGFIPSKDLDTRKLPMLVSIELRTYKQLYTIINHNQSLTEMVSLASSFLNLRSENEIIRIAMKKFEKFLTNPANSAIVIDRREIEDSIEIFPGCGKYNKQERLFPQTSLFATIASLIEWSLKNSEPFFNEKYVLIPTDNTGEHIRFLFLEADELFSSQDLQMLRLFTALMETANNNVSLWERLRVSAHYDSLTGILNRSGFIAAIKKKMITNIPHIIGVLDIDGFSVINNAMGYDFGDNILSAITERLKLLRNNNLILARITADTFGILTPTESINPTAILKIFDKPFMLDGTPFPLKGSLGLSYITASCKDPLKIYNEAQIAMKKAKENFSLKYLYFENSMNNSVQQQIKIIRELRGAIKNKELFLCFHPQFNLKTNHLVGAESLLRWENSSGELIPPSLFIPIAESSGLIVEIGEFVVEESFRQMAEWEEKGLLGFSLALNVSPRQFYDETFISFLSENLKKYKIPPKRIKIEVTESMMIQNMERIIDILVQIRAMGMQIAIDDFGTGFSCLSYLQRLPVNQLKIDGSFVANITCDERSKTISKMIVTLGKSLDLNVIAEGIEKEEELEFLKEIGCDDGQGFIYAEPLNSKDFEIFYNKSKSAENN